MKETWKSDLFLFLYKLWWNDFCLNIKARLISSRKYRMGSKTFSIRDIRLLTDFIITSLCCTPSFWSTILTRKKIYLHKTQTLYSNICKMTNYPLQIYRTILVWKTEKVQLLLRIIWKNYWSSFYISVIEIMFRIALSITGSKWWRNIYVIFLFFQ